MKYFTFRLSVQPCSCTLSSLLCQYLFYQPYFGGFLTWSFIYFGEEHGIQLLTLRENLFKEMMMMMGFDLERGWSPWGKCSPPGLGGVGWESFPATQWHRGGKEMSRSGEGGPCASPWPWGITSLLSLKVWSVGKCSRRDTGFFLAPWGSVRLGCMSCCLLPPARFAGRAGQSLLHVA